MCYKSEIQAALLRDDAILDACTTSCTWSTSSGMGPGSTRTSAVTLATGSWILPPLSSSTATTSIPHASKIFSMPSLGSGIAPTCCPRHTSPRLIICKRYPLQF